MTTFEDESGTAFSTTVRELRRHVTDKKLGGAHGRSRGGGCFREMRQKKKSRWHFTCSETWRFYLFPVRSFHRNEINRECGEKWLKCFLLVL